MPDLPEPIPPVRRWYLIALLLIALPLIGRDRVAIEPDPWGGVNGLRKLIETMREIKRRAADYPGDARLFQAAAYAMAAQVEDKYTGLLPAQSFANVADAMDDTPMGGIGILSTPVRRRGLRVDAVIPGSSAEDAGLAAGDFIVSVEGRDIVNLPRRRMAAGLFGAVDSEVTFSYRRGEDDYTATVKRWAFPPRMVAGADILPGSPPLGYAHLQVFGHGAPRLLAEAIGELRARGARGMILDLRGNAGGEMSAGVAVADLFLAGGVIATVQRGDGHGGWRTDGGGERIYRAEPGGACEDLPLAVLVDGGSASAAELLAAALRDNGRAVVVGGKTFGKARVQEILELGHDSGGGGGGLRITVARFLTPKGVDFEGIGLEPERAVRLSEREEEALRGNLFQQWLGLAPSTPEDPVRELAATVLREQLANPGGSD